MRRRIGVTRRRPITRADVRRIALALPETMESSHGHVPDFRVRGKIFAAFPDEPRTVVLKTSPVNLDALVTADEETFWDEWRGRWLGVRLNRISRRLLRDLVADAWELVAPKRLAMRVGKSRKKSPPPNQRVKLTARVD